ncbi:ribosome maturation factor RimM [Sulfurospirillum multivorans]|uniref:Ribosome maturation factor RimM n=2 Tax=Sulfurospirillum multivorans TaxID=66821 RepID=A0AA86APZ8_SULMK|nr:ribosome maturation factor RimM [Sulfurospirillum multivorans]AHJ13541.1 16S rRNA processing protein RimM [Sulfurospirillum multivorans DSM 12446]QEH07031.1 16S rRNA processing protein RimM [Sulfurospirillum multivorans]
MNNLSSLIEVAQIGRLVGLKGELKLHLQCDFPEQFKKGKTFTTQKGETLEVFSFNQTRGLISFVGYQSREAAAKLVNTFLLTTQENSISECALQEGEFFWFDLIDANVIDEDGTALGTVDEIERIAVTDYLVIKTAEALVQKGLSKTFYLPYIERYILTFDKAKKEVLSKDGLGILENS